MDAGVQLLDLINRRVARGEERHAATAAVFAEHRGLVDDWHHAGEPQEHEMTVYPGEALQQLTTALERTGVPRERAVRMALDRHPALALAHHRGELIPHPPRPLLPAARQRQLWSAEAPLRPGETLLHKLADPSAGGGFFAVMGA